MKVTGKTFVWSPVISFLIYQLNTDQVNRAAQANKFLFLPSRLWSHPSSVVHLATTTSYELLQKSAIIEKQGSCILRDSRYSHMKRQWKNLLPSFLLLLWKLFFS